MGKLHLPQNAYVFIGDGSKALFLRNSGDEKFPNLVTEQVFEHDIPATHELGTDQPGRTFKRAQTNRRSGMDTTDWHDLEEQRFAKRAAAAMHGLVRDRNVKALVVVAPPRTLAELRSAFHAEVKNCIIAEIDKDLTNHPVSEIERHLTG